MDMKMIEYYLKQIEGNFSYIVCCTSEKQSINDQAAAGEENARLLRAELFPKIDEKAEKKVMRQEMNY